MDLYDWILKQFKEGVTIYTVMLCFGCIMFMGYVIYLGSKAKRFILKTKWLGLEVVFDNSPTFIEKGGASPLKEVAGRNGKVEKEK